MNCILRGNFRNNILGLYDFYVTAKHQNMRTAAAFNNINQSTICRSIKNLENRCCFSLIITHNRGVRLTESGNYLFRSLHDYFY